MKLIVLVVLFIVSSCYKDRIDYLQEDWGEVTFVSQHNIYVASNGYDVDPDGFESEVDRVISLWQMAFAGEGINCDVNLSLDQIFVAYTSAPFYDIHYMNGQGKLAGISYLSLSLIRVGYTGDFQKSALGHELGHEILFRCLQDYSHENMEIYNKKYGTPY